MKPLLTLFICVLISFVSKSQNFILNFEDTAIINQVYYTDTILDPQHIWQIGVPNKPFFDSAYSPPNAVVTLLDSSLPANVKASFIIKTKLTYALWVYSIVFQQKFDLDSTHEGGYIQYSIDSGMNWNNLFTSNNFWINYLSPEWTSYGCTGGFPTDTLRNGNPYISGRSIGWCTTNGWDKADIYYGCFYIPSSAIWFKFTVFSDSGTSAHSGWMIDNIQYTAQQAINCPYGINEINSSHIKVYPDPVTDGFTLSLIDAGVHDYSLSIIDLMGRELLYRDEQEPEVTLNRGDIAAGSYVIKVTDRQTGNMMEKRVVFE